MSRSVRRARIALGLILGISPGAAAYSQEPKWQRDYAAARAEAKESNRPLLLDFGTEHCPWCVKLDATFRSPAVAKMISENFTAVKVDADRQPKLAQAAGVHSYPTLLLVHPDGTIAGRREGYADERELLQFLRSVKAESPVAHAAAEGVLDAVVRCRVTVIGGRDAPEAFRPNR